jgi:hypothetical protein
VEDKATLLRRVTYDLTGLPPTEKEIAAFLADDSPTPSPRWSIACLPRPRYGERWGRHWLDVARYADSTGNDEDHRYPYAWRYRDYVIEAFNRDLPYDQFVREQIAGDLLPAENGRGQPARHRRHRLPGARPKAIAQQDKKKMLYDVYDEQVDVVSKAFLGLTIACARCHDHKFDPILTKDYYSLIGIFASTRNFKDSEGARLETAVRSAGPKTRSTSSYRDHSSRRCDANYKFEPSRSATDAEKEGYGRSARFPGSPYMLAARAVVYAEGRRRARQAVADGSWPASRDSARSG